ncbi:MAG: sulfite exporter TauE/SafE family protein [Phycisphaerales bacterium]
MPLHTMIFAGGAVFAGVLLQGAVGFGMGLFSIPIMLWLGIDLPVAIAALTVSTFAQSIYGAMTYRQHIPWPAVARTTPLRLIFMLVGLAALWRIDSLPRHNIKQIIGAAILTILVAQQALRAKPRHVVPIGWAWLAASLSGFMAGAIGMGGPPIVLWAMAHDWPSRVTRSFFWVSFGLLSPVMIVAMALTFGSPVWHGLLLGLICAPLTLLGARLGMGIGERLNRQRLRSVTVALLVLIAVGAIVEPWLSDRPAIRTSQADSSPAPSRSFDPGDSPARR